MMRNSNNKNKRTAAPKKGNANRVWRFIRPAVVLLISTALSLFLLVTAVNIVLHKYIYPVDPNDATPVKVVISNSSSASTIAKLLYEAGSENGKGLIANKAVFTIYVDFVGKAKKLKAGTYYLSRNMTIPQMVDVICQGNPPATTIRFTIKEGATIDDIAAVLVDKGLFNNASDFQELCRTGRDFMDYSFIAGIETNSEQARDYLLEGYLFPDTYDVFSDSLPETVIKKMLMRFNEVFTDDYIARAQELGLSIDDVVTLASLIEKEAKLPDFRKVSAVFHNRLKAGDTLGSDATIQYITKQHKLIFTSEELSNPSLYNTYLYTGLPLGPIANPGKAAIEAALYPDEEYLEENYYYFCLKDGKTGELVFSKTLSEHNANVEAYKPYW